MDSADGFEDAPMDVSDSASEDTKQFTVTSQDEKSLPSAILEDSIDFNESVNSNLSASLNNSMSSSLNNSLTKSKSASEGTTTKRTARGKRKVDSGQNLSSSKRSRR